MEAIRKLKCDDRFNLKRVFEWILLQASTNDVEPRDIVKTIFVITGKDFKQAIVPSVYIWRAEDMGPENFNPKDVRRWNDNYRIVCEMLRRRAMATVCLGSSSGT